MPQQNSGMMAAGGIAGGVGNMLGGILGVAAAEGEQRRMNAQLAQSLAQLQGYANTGHGLFEQSLGNTGYQGAQKAMQQGGQRFNSLYNGMHLPGFSMPNSFQGGLGMVGQQGMNRLAQGNEANMQGYKNFGFQIPLNNVSTESQLGANNGLAQASTSPFGPLMAQASQSKAAMGAIGSLLGTGSTLAGQYMMLPSQQQPMGQPNQQQMNGLQMGFGPVSQGYAQQLNGFPSGTLGFGGPLY